MITYKQQNEYNELIAKFLGWYKQEDQLPNTWFKKDDCSQFVIYKQYEDNLKELPFHKNWDYLMDAVIKIENLGYGMEIIPAGTIVYDMKKAQTHSRFESMILPVFYKTNTKINNVWWAVVRFVEWYNKNEK